MLKLLKEHSNTKIKFTYENRVISQAKCYLNFGNHWFDRKKNPEQASF